MSFLSLSFQKVNKFLKLKVKITNTLIIENNTLSIEGKISIHGTMKMDIKKRHFFRSGVYDFKLYE